MPEVFASSCRVEVSFHLFIYKASVWGGFYVQNYVFSSEYASILSAYRANPSASSGSSAFRFSQEGNVVCRFYVLCETLAPYVHGPCTSGANSSRDACNSHAPFPMLTVGRTTLQQTDWKPAPPEMDSHRHYRANMPTAKFANDGTSTCARGK